MQPLQKCIGPTSRIGREILCLPCAGFFIQQTTFWFVKIWPLKYQLDQKAFFHNTKNFCHQQAFFTHKKKCHKIFFHQKKIIWSTKLVHKLHFFGKTLFSTKNLNNLKTQIVIILKIPIVTNKKSTCDKNLKIKLRQKLKNSNINKTWKPKLWRNANTQIVRRKKNQNLKLWENSNSKKNTTSKRIATKFRRKKFNCGKIKTQIKLNCDKTKTQIVTKLETNILTKL